MTWKLWLLGLLLAISGSLLATFEFADGGSSAWIAVYAASNLMAIPTTQGLLYSAILGRPAG